MSPGVRKDASPGRRASPTLPRHVNHVLASRPVYHSPELTYLYVKTESDIRAALYTAPVMYSHTLFHSRRGLRVRPGGR